MKKILSRFILLIFIINNFYVTTYANDIEIVNEKIFIKNSGFESNFENWNFWKVDSNIDYNIDNQEKYDGNTSLKIYSKNENYTRGILYQDINVNGLLGKSFKLKEYIKTDSVNGNFSIRIKFFNKKGELLEEDIKKFLLKSSLDWQEKSNYINIPNNDNIDYLRLEYIYENFKGDIWIDNISIEQVNNLDNDLLIRNSGFEDESSYWSIWTQDNNLSIDISNNIYKTGYKSLNFKSDKISRGIVSQEINLNESQEAINLSYSIKTQGFDGGFQIRIKFIGDNGEQIGNIDTKEILLNKDQEWILNENKIKISNDKIKKINIEFIYNNSKGNVWIDDIKTNLIDLVEDGNIFKNPDFSEGISYWNTWSQNSNIKFNLEKDSETENNVMHIYNKSNVIDRGILSQEVEISSKNKINYINVEQYIKTQNLSGDNIQVRIGFYLSEKKVDEHLYNIDIEENQEWKKVNYDIEVIEQEIDQIKVEYLFENITGDLWIKDIKGILSEDGKPLNLIKNGSFESTISDPVTIWYLSDIDNQIQYEVDKEIFKQGNNSLKIKSNSYTSDAKISQSISITDRLKGKIINLSEYIKSSNNNAFIKRITYLDKDNKEIINSVELKNKIYASSEWQYYSNNIKVPIYEELDRIVIEYVFNSLNGSIYLDDIQANEYMQLEDISLSNSYINIRPEEKKILNINFSPTDYYNKNLKIEVENKEIAIIEDNHILGVSQGITKLVIKDDIQGIKYEFPVIVNSSPNLMQVEIIDKYINSKESLKIKKDNNIDYESFIEPINGKLDLSKDEEFIYYNLDGDKDFFVIKEESINKKIFIYNINIKKVDSIDIKNNVISTLINEKVSGNITAISKSKTIFELAKSADHGNFQINKLGEYEYVPDTNYYGYDSVEIKIKNDNNEIVENIKLYVAPDTDIIKSKLNKSYPKVLLFEKDYDYINELIETDYRANEWFNIIKQETDKILNQPIIEYSTDINGNIDVSITKKYIENLSFMYKFTNDKKYADRAWLEIENACKYSDWNKNEFLDSVGLAVAISIGYDTLYNYLKVEQRDLIENTIIDKVLKLSIEDYKNNSGFTAMNNNWNIACNAGIIFSSLTIANDKNYDITLLNIQEALKSIQPVLYSYYKDGSSYEGPGYWDFATSFIIYAINSIENSLDLENPFSMVLDIENLADFPNYINGSKSSFNFSDSDDWSIPTYYGIWFAKELNNSIYTKYSAEEYRKTKYVTVYDLLWYNPKLYNDEAITQLDYIFENSQIVTMRSSFAYDLSNFVSFKGGTTGLDHGDLDIGSFVFDSLGVRWAEDLGKENYNLEGYWDNDYNGKRWTYYRKRAEGHNTLYIGENFNEDQVINSTSKIVESNLNVNNPYAILDMTPAYSDKAIKVTRKLQLINGRRDLIITDDFLLNKEETVIWQMHTKADIEEISEDGKCLILYKDGQRLKMIIEESESLKFEVTEAIPYEMSPNPNEQASNDEYKKIIIKNNSKSGSIKVKMTPLGDINSNYDLIKNYSFEDELESWSIWDSYGNLSVKVDNYEVYDGNKSLSISSKDKERARGTVSQVIYLNRYFGEEISIQQYIKSINFEGNIEQRVMFLDNSGNQISESILREIKNYDDWTLTKEKYNIPKNTSKINIEYIYDGIGEIRIDKVEIVNDNMDLNSDGNIDILDLAILGLNYNIKVDGSGRDNKLDINKDNIIDLYDMIIISKYIV